MEMLINSISQITPQRAELGKQNFIKEKFIPSLS